MGIDIERLGPAAQKQVREELERRRRAAAAKDRHCVGGYGKAHCSGESIFFIRHTESPGESYFTLQLDTATGKVLQNRGRHNCARTPEVEAFEQAWLCQVVKPWLDHKQKTVNPNHAKTAAA